MMNKAFDEKLIRSPISPAHFFSNDAEKTKLNWFRFEFARELESFILEKKSLFNKLNKSGVSRNVLAGFCIHYANRMEDQILDRAAGRIQEVDVDVDDISACIDQIDSVFIDELFAIAEQALDSMIEACGSCPSRCIAEKDQYAPMFDNPDLWA